MQNKCIRKIAVVKEGDEFVVNIYGTRVGQITGQITVLRARIDGVKVVLLTDQKKTSAGILVGSKYSSGINSKTPVINKEL
jgi:hypothetical protein